MSWFSSPEAIVATSMSRKRSAGLKSFAQSDSWQRSACKGVSWHGVSWIFSMATVNTWMPWIVLSFRFTSRFVKWWNRSKSKITEKKFALASAEFVKNLNLHACVAFRTCSPLQIPTNFLTSNRIGSGSSWSWNTDDESTVFFASAKRILNVPELQRFLQQVCTERPKNAADSQASRAHCPGCWCSSPAALSTHSDGPRALWSCLNCCKRKTKGGERSTEKFHHKESWLAINKAIWSFTSLSYQPAWVSEHCSHSVLEPKPLLFR